MIFKVPSNFQHQLNNPRTPENIVEHIVRKEKLKNSFELYGVILALISFKLLLII
jgi:hypothetical protein